MNRRSYKGEVMMKPFCITLPPSCHIWLYVSVVEPGKPAWKKIREQFGDRVFLEDGHLDREEMGRLVFSDANKRRQLNAITHPEIRNAMFWEIFLYFLKGWLVFLV